MLMIFKPEEHKTTIMRFYRKYRFIGILLFLGLVYWNCKVVNDWLRSTKELSATETSVSSGTIKDVRVDYNYIKNREISFSTHGNVTQTRVPVPRIPRPGDNGAEVKIDQSQLSDKEKQEYKTLYDRNSFNEFASNLISLHRTLPDYRTPECRNMTYSKSIPQTSVIITFYNEAWSTLLRSVHSVIDRSPSYLLREIILVDDGSDKEILKAPLSDYLAELPVVKLVRSKKREGLIRARLLGYQHATAPILTFLDSHIECSPGWLEPLISPIVEDESVVTVPLIDIIDYTTLKYNPVEVKQYGVLRWRSLTFNWGWIPKSVLNQRKSSVENIRSPTMPGGLFSISKSYFTKIGTYDPGLEGWGGENLELSFKIWMCNGSLIIIPCSHVGHIFRNKMPYSLGRNALQDNSLRVAEVWMDEYKQYYYDYVSHNMTGIDIRDRIALRKSLQCKPFDWYYKNILSATVWAPVDALLAGKIFSLNMAGWCLDSLLGDGKYGMFSCSSDVNGNQNFYYTSEGMVRTEVFKPIYDVCISSFTTPTSLVNCDVTCKYQIWKYQNNQFYNPATDKCLAYPVPNHQEPPEMVLCNDVNRTKWQMYPRNATINKV